MAKVKVEQSIESESGFNLVKVLSCLILPLVTVLVLDIPYPTVVAVFLTAVLFWLTEAIPLPATGLLIPVLICFYGVLPARDAFASFGNDILFLFVGCFLLCLAMQKHGFDKRMAYFLLGRALPSSSFFAINCLIAGTSFFLSMWISNTSATAIMSAVTLGILTSLDKKLPADVPRQRVAVRLLLSCAFAASIGGLVTPIGSPPNLIALKYLDSQGVRISFLDWMLIGLPIALVMLILLLLILGWRYPLPNLKLPGIKKQFNELLQDLGPLSRAERQVGIVFFLAISAWILPGILTIVAPEQAWIKTLNSRLAMSVVGLSAGLALFFLPVSKGKFQTPNLYWSEAARLDWGTIMLFGGGLSLGDMLEKSGAAEYYGGLLLQGGSLNLILLGMLVVVISILMSEFASNTAAASILIPLIIATVHPPEYSVMLSTAIVLAATFGASFGFMLPVSTPPNAIVYGTGKVPAKEMLRSGAYFDVLGALLIILCLVAAISILN